MKNRYLTDLQVTLFQTTNKTLYSSVSPIYELQQKPVILTGQEIGLKTTQLIQSAKQEVLVLFYKFDVQSDLGRQIYDSLLYLKRKAQETKIPINICILINSLHPVTDFFYRENTDSGLENLQSDDYFNIHFATHETFAFGSLKSKMIIVDGHRATILSGDADATSNRKQHIATMIKGLIVNDMRDDFNQLWFKYTKNQLTALTEDPHNNEHAPSTHVPCFFISKQEKGNPFSLYSPSPYQIALVSAIKKATKCIHVMTPHLNDPYICEALADACNQGIEIKILTRQSHPDMGIILNKIKTEHLNHIQIRYAAMPDDDEPDDIIAKYISVDEILVFVGSSSPDVQDMKYSRVADVIFEDEETVRDFENNIFGKQFQNGTNHYQDAFFQLIMLIDKHYIRIDNNGCIEKSDKLQNMLTDITNSTDEPLNKIQQLIYKSLPILKEPTWINIRNPYSYRDVYNQMIMLGFKSIIDEIVPEDLKLLTNSPYTFKFNANNAEVELVDDREIELRP